MMSQFKRSYLFIFVLVLAMLACQSSPARVPSQPVATEDLNAAIVSTANAARTLTALVPTATFTPSQTATQTLTPTETPSPTDVFTATLEIPLISVSVATNCRNGPGKVYDYQSALVIGKTVEIFAKEPSGNYWYIRNPESTDEAYCWVWGKYATVVGNISALPMYTPPPTPTATITSVASITPTITLTKKAAAGSFVVSYNNLDTCGGNWRVDFKLRNNGSVPFQSFKLNMDDLTGSTSFDNASNVFADLSGCAPLSSKDALDPGDILLFSGPDFPYDPTGHKLRISLTLCTEDGRKGSCIKQNLDVQL